MLFLNGLSSIEVVKQLNAFLTESDAVLYNEAHRWQGDWVDTLYHAVKVNKPFYGYSIYDLFVKWQV